MPDADRIDAYARAFLEIVQAEGRLADVEDELFRFARAVESSNELLLALADSTLPAARRMAVVEDILGPKALRITTALAAFVVAAGRGHDLPAIIDRFVELAAGAREREVAEVRTAVPLDEATVERLADALGRATGSHVEVKVVIDESVLGGVVARIGDLVIDGTVRHRLEQMKEQI